MKKIMLGTILMLFMMTCLSACGTTYQEASGNTGRDWGNGYFTVVTTWDDAANTYSIVYANDTKVKYFVVRSGYRFGITPLYNTDGTLQIYDEEE